MVSRAFGSTWLGSFEPLSSHLPQAQKNTRFVRYLLATYPLIAQPMSQQASGCYEKFFFGGNFLNNHLILWPIINPQNFWNKWEKETAKASVAKSGVALRAKPVYAKEENSLKPKKPPK